MMWKTWQQVFEELSDSKRQADQIASYAGGKLAVGLDLLIQKSAVVVDCCVLER